MVCVNLTRGAKKCSTPWDYVHSDLSITMHWLIQLKIGLYHWFRWIGCSRNVCRWSNWNSRIYCSKKFLVNI
jgi:hypothetical protein